MTDIAGLALDPLERLAARIREKEATVAVIGLGYVGLPLLVAMNGAGFPVIGLDADPGKIDRLNGCRSYIVDVTDSEVESLERATFSTDPSVLDEADVIVMCLPTPLADGVPDLTMVRIAAEEVARHLKP